MGLNAAALKQQIVEGAAELTRLHARIHETFKARDNDAASHQAWSAACDEFHARYSELAFPGGYVDAVARIQAGDPDTIEAAMCFLELRPYFFRSGYIYQRLVRKMKRAPLDAAQSKRFLAILHRVEDWQRKKAAAA